MLVALLVLVAACVRSSSERCSDDRVCPEGTVCADVANPQLIPPLEHLCVPPEDRAACRDQAAFAACTPQAGGVGRCYDGVCLPGGCGNHRLDPDEACDDGNAIIGDGCSVSCTSDERCGNGFVDPVRLVPGPDDELVPVPHEACDDGNLVGHDGCDSRCQPESVQWHRLDLDRPSPRRFDAAMAFDAARGRFVLFGGRRDSGQNLADTWESAGDAWVRVTHINGPSPRTGHAMVYDAERRRIVLFGGNGTLSDTWEWDGVTWTLRTPPISPPGRDSHSLTYDAGRKRVVMFGGRTAPSIDGLGDTWEWDGQTWTQITTTPQPEPRREHAMTYDPRRGVIVMTGGVDGGTYRQTTWELAGSTWTPIPNAQAPALQRFAMAYDPIGEHVLAYGDNGALTAVTTTTWAYVAQQWTNVGALTPGRRLDTRMASDATGKRLWMFGGYDSVLTDKDDTWTWDGTSWTEVTPVTPTPLAYRAAAFDPIRGELVAHGGKNDSGQYRDETSVLAGTAWSIAGGPSPRAGAAMAYDLPGRRMLMLGGANPSILDEAFTWDGRQWTPLVVTSRPIRRALHAMTSDPVRGRIVLFGGIGPGVMLDDTWEWDGTTWTNPMPALRPPARYGHTLTYDPVRARVVLIGGTSADSGLQLDDAWEWDGTAWMLLAPVNPPVARDGHGTAWDAARRRLTVFAGATTNQVVLDDALELGSAWRPLPTQLRPEPRAGHVLAPAADGAGLMMIGGASAAARGSGAASLSAASFADQLWRLRHDGVNPYEICTGSYDNDGDGLVGCADHDCDAQCARCGDGECTALETCRNCPGDCACTPVCGDFVCDPGEAAAACPGDCS